MPGLDRTVLDQIDPELALGRIKNDLPSDFILSPHYGAVFEHVGAQLWGELEASLRSGNYEPSLPIILEVPKANGITRPGAILNPTDRLVYQAIVDILAPIGEAQLDRARTFSHVLQQPDPLRRMFEPGHVTYERLQAAVKAHCENGNYEFAIRADIASFFERVYQHNIINLLHSSGCPGPAVNLLEKLLLAWREKNSHGILQGMFPSDFLGSFSLCSFDSELDVKGVPSARYVDDTYIFFQSALEAKKGLVDLCLALRNEGLSLNEQKTSILPSAQLLYEETQIDTMFQAARDEVEEEVFGNDLYGFQVTWMPEEDAPDEEDIELRSVEALYHKVEESGTPADKIERFCLPFLAAGRSEIAVEKALQGLLERPHLAKVYSSYLIRLGKANPDIGRRLQRLLRDGAFAYDWQPMWIIGALLYLDAVENSTVTTVMRVLLDHTRSPALRAVCALFIGRHGDAARRRNLRTHYGTEPSDYVRAAILFASRYFPISERRTCLTAWGGHSNVNSLIARAVQALT
jgi:hypothetical protein